MNDLEAIEERLEKAQVGLDVQTRLAEYHLIKVDVPALIQELRELRRHINPTHHIWGGGICKSCGHEVLMEQGMAKDYLWSCSNKNCIHSYFLDPVETYDDETPYWVHHARATTDK